MSDKELVERLRVLDPWVDELEVIDEAADRIEALTEQLEAARADAKEAEAYAEELEEKLRARTAERNHANDVTDAAIEEVNRLKALLAKAVEALKHAKLNMPHPDQMVDDTLAEIEGSNAP
jgi:chromosome segregation ATPase